MGYDKVINITFLVKKNVHPIFQKGSKMCLGQNEQKLYLQTEADNIKPPL